MEDTKKRVSGESAAATIPKKRGRPAKLNKVKKLPSGRGRGRPAKNAAGTTKKVAEVSDDDSGGAVANGGSETASPGRGRPAKQGKLKVAHPIESTGKGRGRPKAVPNFDQDDEDDDGDEEDDDEADQSSDYKSGGGDAKPKKKMASKAKSPKKQGRPKKVVNSDEDDDDSDYIDEARPLGRPPTGAVNLNIERTGRGQGRPKKTADVADGGKFAKKRGRPSSGKTTTPYVATGKPRGRPTANDTDDGKKHDADGEQDDEEDDVDNITNGGEEHATEIDDGSD